MAQPDELITIRQLKGKKMNPDDVLDQYDLDLNKATGSGESNEFLSKLSRIVQLTGFLFFFLLFCFVEFYLFIHLFILQF